MTAVNHQPVELVPDCWSRVVHFLRDDQRSLGRLLATSKAMFSLVVPNLYRRPFERSILGEQFPSKTQNKSRIALEFLLLTHAGWPDLDAPEIVAMYGQTPYTFPKPGRINYYDLVEFLPDSSLLAAHQRKNRLGNETTDRARNNELQWKYRCFCAPKIKEMQVNIWDPLLLNHFPIFGALEYLAFDWQQDNGENRSPWGDPTMERPLRQDPDKIMKEINGRVKALLQAHHAAHPGTIKMVGFLIHEGNGMDPARLLLVRDALGGRWCQKYLFMELPFRPDDAMQELLKDEELPKQLRTCTFDVNDPQSSVNWNNHLGPFLSKCRSMGYVYLANCGLDVMAWSANDRRRFQKTSKFGSWEPLAEWKVLSLTYARSKDVLNAVKVLQDAVFGLEHSLERLSFKVQAVDRYRELDPFSMGYDFSNPEHLNRFQMLTIPDSWRLNKLTELEIQHPRIGDISLNHGGFQNLKRLLLSGPSPVSLEGQLANMDGNEELLLPKWRAPDGIEDLFIENRVAARFDFESLQFLTRLQNLTVKISSLEYGRRGPLINFDDSYMGEESTGKKPFREWSLPFLKRIELHDVAVKQLQANLCLVSPNIRHVDFLVLDPVLVGLELDLSGLGSSPPCTSERLSLPVSDRCKPRQFPELQMIGLRGKINISPENFALALDPDLFPNLQNLSVGFTLGTNDKIDAYTSILKKAMDQERHFVFDMLVFGLADNLLTQWKAWLISEEVGFVAGPELVRRTGPTKEFVARVQNTEYRRRKV